MRLEGRGSVNRYSFIARSKVIRPIGDVSILHNSIRTAPNTFVSSKINTKIPEKTRIIGSIRNVNNLFRENRKRWKICIAWNIRKFETFDSLLLSVWNVINQQPNPRVRRPRGARLLANRARNTEPRKKRTMPRKLRNNGRIIADLAAF